MLPREPLSTQSGHSRRNSRDAAGTIVHYLARIEFFTQLNEEQLARVAARAEFVDFERGQTVLQEGERSDDVLILMRGSLEVFRLHQDGTVQTIDVLGEGALIGEMAVLLNEPRSVSVRTRRLSRLIRIDGSFIEELFHQHADLTLRCARKLAERLKRRTNKIGCEIPVKTIAVVPLCDVRDIREFLPDAAQQFPGFGR